MRDDKSKLAVDFPPERKSIEAKKVKIKSSEMPDWAKKFAETKNIDVQSVSFPEPT